MPLALSLRRVPNTQHTCGPLQGGSAARHTFLVPECVAKGSRSTLGVLEWSCVRWTLLCRLQPSATVCNRWRLLPYGPTAAKAVTFGWFKHCVTLFSVAGVALREILAVSKIFLCDRSNTFASFSKDSWQVQHFGDLHRHFVWQARHFRPVVLRVFLRIALAGRLRDGDKRVNSVAGVAFSDKLFQSMQLTLRDAFRPLSIGSVNAPHTAPAVRAELTAVRIV
eukprot:s443_g14.t1